MKRFLALLFCSFSALAANYAPPPVVPDYSSLTNRAGSLINLAAIVLGATNALDGNGGVFIYAVSTQTVDNLTVLPSTSTSRWLRTSYIFSTTPATSPLTLSNGTLSLANITNWFTFSAGTNMQVTVTSNTVSYAMTNTTFSGSGGSAISFNGTAVTNVNLTNSHAVRWTGVDTNYQAYITNYFYWEGIPVQFPTLRDDPYITWGQAGSNLTATIPAEALDPTRWEHLNWPTLMGRYSASIGDIEYITVGANLNLDSSSGVLSAVIPPGTNSWQIGVDGTLVVTPNLADSSELDPTATSTNITYAIVSESIATNKINTTFQHLLLNQYRVNNLTNWFLGITNSATVTWATNANGDWAATASASGGGGLGTNLFVNNVLLQPAKLTNSATVTWGTNANGDIIATAAAGSSGLGTNIFVNGVLLQPAYLTNSAEVFISTNGNGHIVFDVNDWEGFWSDLTNSLVASNNIAFAYDTSNNKLMISAVVSTNSGTAVTVDGGADLSRANFADASTTGLFDISGTNITFRLPDRDFGAITVSSSGAAMALDDSTVTSNKIVAANVTIDKLSATGTPLSTNFLAGDYSWKQVTTNMIPGLVADILSAATNGPAGGGGGGSGTNFVLNGVLMQPAIVTNSATVTWSTNGSGHISATVTNVAGSTTSNVVQKIGGVLFYNSTGTTQSGESYFGIATNVLINAASGAVPLQATVSLSGAPSTNYVVIVEPYDINGSYSGSSMAFSVRDKTTTGFQFTAEFGGAALAGTWYRVWILDTVSVGGSGGDVISTANNNFTQTNNFSGPVNAATLTVNDNAYGAGWDGSTNVPSQNAVYDKIQTLGSSSDFWSDWDDWETVTWTFAGNSAPANLEPGLSFTAVASGLHSINAGLSGSGVSYIRTAASASLNTGGYIHNNSPSAMVLTNRATQFQLSAYMVRTNGSISRFGFGDSLTTTEPTDALMFTTTNEIAWPVALNNGTKTVAASGYTLQQNIPYTFKLYQTNDFARFIIMSNVVGGADVEIYNDTIGSGLPLGASRSLNITVGGINTITANTNQTDIIALEHMCSRRYKR